MASTSSAAAGAASDPPPLEVPPWLKSLPLAPEYHPTVAEFQDPIAYILKIEKEASAYGICKIVPPVPAAPKKTAVSNINRSFAARDPSRKPPTFTTRQQQIGFCPRRPRPVQKPVWQSGEHYTLHQFEAKARQFERSHLKRAVPSFSSKKGGGSPAALSPLEIETLFWRASADKPLSVEYANDMPGSGFAPLGAGKRWREEEAANVGETAWNMRGVSRAKGSLLRFMKEEIPGVTSPMVYVAMMFSWFAWHVEDHELHSLNYLHMGAGKTWYGVPRDGGLAFEEVVRAHGYGGELNPLVTFAILGEKTTVMSPEVLVGAGIPCCRLVQNAGEFVVTFPGAYHSGFSLGFNCGEAANIATPGWLSFAKEAAIRRASINYPPMVSHFQLLYALALSLHSRVPTVGGSEPRSSRLKDKMKGEGEELIKKAFVQNAIQNNRLLSLLLHKGSSCIILPQNASENPISLNSLVRNQMKVKPRLSLGLCTQQEALEASGVLPSNDIVSGWNSGGRDLKGFFSYNGNSRSIGHGKVTPSETCRTGWGDICSSSSDSQNAESETEGTLQGDGLLDQGLLSCVTCGILSFSCVAVIQPRETTAKYLMSADYGFLNDRAMDLKETHNMNKDISMQTRKDIVVHNGVPVERNGDSSLVRGSTYSIPFSDQNMEMSSAATCPKGSSALDLLASAYGDSSDTEEEVLHERSACLDENDLKPTCVNDNPQLESALKHPVHSRELPHDETNMRSCGVENDSHVCSGRLQAGNGLHIDGIADEENYIHNQPESERLAGRYALEDNLDMSYMRTGNTSSCIHLELVNIEKGILGKTKSSTHLPHRTDKDSSRMHVFCLEHAVEVERHLQPIGGVYMMLLCHPDYVKFEAEAKVVGKELGVGYFWKDINFREADKQDQERICQALEDEEIIPMSSDWTVKLGINMYYTASLSKSPLYSKQMPYNSVIYKAFGHSSPGNLPLKQKSSGRKPGRQKKIVVVGRWCGKVWMSNQVHSYLALQSEQQQEQMEILLDDSDDEKPLIQLITDQATPVALSKIKLSRNSLKLEKISGKKRKKPLRKSSSKKPKYAEEENNTKTEDITETSASLSGRVLRSRPLKQKVSKQPKLDFKDDKGGSSSRLRKQSSKSDEPRSKSVKQSAKSEEPRSKSERQSSKSEELRSKSVKRSSKSEEAKNKSVVKKHSNKKNKSRAPNATAKDEEKQHICDIDGCSMSFGTKQELALHKRDICPVKGCGKKFFSHKYLVQHRKVHMDERPLVCPWKGCKMTFKWAWARTEHIRVHTGDRPYICREPGCGQTFRFVSDFSRHKRKTGHSVKKGRR